MDLIQSLIAIPEAAAHKQALQIKAGANPQANQLSLAQASTMPQILPFKKQLHDVTNLKVV
jgi:hypothetical protein